jgi:hypothetical protein
VRAFEHILTLQPIPTAEKLHDFSNQQPSIKEASAVTIHIPMVWNIVCVASLCFSS